MAKKKYFLHKDKHNRYWMLGPGEVSDNRVKQLDGVPPGTPYSGVMYSDIAGPYGSKADADRDVNNATAAAELDT